MESRTLFVFAALVMTVGCAGQVQVVSVTPERIRSGNAIDGVVFYQPVLVKLTYQYTTLVDSNGKVIGRSDNGTCRQAIQKEETTVMPDLEHPMIIRNASGRWSSAKFSVTMSNGLLTSVNAEPTQKASELLTAVSGAVTAFSALGVALDSTTACNASPVLAGIRRARIEQ